MAKQSQDGSTGDVVIRPGSPPANGGGGGGFFTIGGGGGFSGGFGGSSKKRRKARARARRAQEQARAQAAAQAQAAAAQAQEHARAQAARQQLLARLTQRHNTIRAEVDRTFATRSGKLAESIQSEISAAKKPPDNKSSERWQLYLITKEKTEVDGLISRKNAELNAKHALARSFDGHDPLTRSANDYLTRLTEFGAALNDGHQSWENAYNAAHEARLLSTQIQALTDKSSALARHHAEQTIVWRAREQEWERQRLHAEQRDARIRFKQQADADVRHERVRAANTLTVPATSVAAGGMVLTRGGAWVVEGAAVALEAAITRATGEILRIAAIRTGPVVGLFFSSMFYSPMLGNGELTAEQRSRLFQGIGVRADLMGLPEGRDLQAIVDAGGSVDVTYRIKPEAVQGGTAIIVASTGGLISASVPVVNAVFDPLTGTFHAEIPGFPARHLQFPQDATVPSTQQPKTSYPGLSFSASQAQDIPAGVDTRINDCIVCIPGLPPTYLSFGLPPVGSGIVTGSGQTTTWDWWKAASQEKGAPIPAQIGDQFRGREIPSFGAFDKALWRTVAEDTTLTSSFDEVNKKRIEQGFAPVAPKNTWVDDRREYEVRYRENAAQGANPYDLDAISITPPRSAQGTRGVTPAFTPWSFEFANSEAHQPIGSRTWTPLVPPGSESLGSTTSPITPSLPGVYPGDTISPVLPENETFPAIDEGDIGASIPGYPVDPDLPSPGLVFVGPPVEPLEVGAYNDLTRRSVRDGLDIDHIPSRKALERYLELNFPELPRREVDGFLNRAPSIAIPARVHQRYSETYGGRNSKERQTVDSSDIRNAVDSNFDAIKKGLLEEGFSEAEIGPVREQLHTLSKEQGWY